jgi:hypothetical protein
LGRGEDVPASGGRVDGKCGKIAGTGGAYVLGEIDWVVLPLGVPVGPEGPAFVWDESAVFGPRCVRCVCWKCQDWNGRQEAGGGGGLEEGAAGEVWGVHLI